MISRRHQFPLQKKLCHATNLQPCIDDCTRGHAVCTETIQYCLEKSGQHAERNDVRRMQDCAEMGLTAADFMQRGSDFDPQTGGVCAEACDRGARSCEQFGGNAVPMRDCAETCLGWRKAAAKCLPWPTRQPRPVQGGPSSRPGCRLRRARADAPPDGLEFLACSTPFHRVGACIAFPICRLPSGNTRQLTGPSQAADCERKQHIRPAAQNQRHAYRQPDKPEP